MNDLLSSTSLPIPFSVDNIATAPKYSQLWEVVLVAASPVVLVFCLCFCIVCLVFRKHETVADTTVVQHQPRRNAFANLLRNLPPPPKYDVAVTTSSPPPLYSDVEKSIIFDPLAAMTAARRAAAQGVTPTASSLSIQYLYPPRYDSQSEPAAVHRVSTPPSPPAYSTETIDEESLSEEDLPTYSPPGPSRPISVSA